MAADPVENPPIVDVASSIMRQALVKDIPEADKPYHGLMRPKQNRREGWEIGKRHLPFYEHLKKGGVVKFRNSLLKDMAEDIFLTLDHEKIKGDPSNIEFFGYMDLTIVPDNEVPGAIPAMTTQEGVPFPHLKPTKYPDGNPKTAFGVKKPPTMYCPTTAHYEWGLAQLHGALKYGHYNWRKDPVSLSTYINALQRHLDLFKEGEQHASDSTVHHLGHVMACAAIMIDAMAYGSVIDDRTQTPIELEKFFQSREETVKFLYNNWGPKEGESK